MADDFDDSDVRPSAREVNEELRRVAAVRLQEFCVAVKGKAAVLLVDLESMQTRTANLIHEVKEIVSLVELLEPKE